MDSWRCWAWYANKVRPTLHFQVKPLLAYSSILHSRIPATPSQTNIALPRMGLNQIPTGILIRARLLKLKAGGIPGFIIKRSAGSRRGSVGSSCWRITVRIGFLGHKTKLYKLPPNWTSCHKSELSKLSPVRIGQQVISMQQWVNLWCKGK